jgi:23S rRNA pseudouridine1911/1915/1917 synthase
MEPEILFEDNYLLVVNKPSGLMVHPDGKHTEPTLTDWLLVQYPQLKGVGESLTLSNGMVIDRPGIVHRLDRETSGVMVVAKNQETFLELKEKFKSREVEKVYNAFLYGTLPEARGVINKPIGKSTQDFRKFSAQRGARGALREAVTQYEVLCASGRHSFVEMRPKTGRTHQLRVHAKAIHHPVVGDTLYAPNHPPALGFTRLALHAHTLTIPMRDGSSRTFEAPLPEDFLHALALLKEEGAHSETR